MKNKMAASSAASWLRRSIYGHTRSSDYLSYCFKRLARNCGKRWPTYRGCSSFYGAADHDADVSDPHSTASTFETMVRERRRRSSKSVLVHVYSKLQVPRLHAHCQSYGAVQRASHYTLGNDKDFVLVEFEDEKSVLDLLQSASHFGDAAAIPVHSRFLWYKETDSDDDRMNADQTPLVSDLSNAIHYETRPTAESLLERIHNANSVSEQMKIHHDNVKLTEFGQQLRFFVCHQLESSFSGLFSECVVLPYGSSVNGFGKFDGDLDMVLTFENAEKKSDDSPLFFHTKRSLANGRVQTQRYLEIFGDIIGSFFPGCFNVQRILHARVPIVKFQQELVNLECDLSMSNLSGVYMSELLYLYGELDARVRPLVSTVLRWAKVNGLTHENPGRWITNFTLILMVTVFLQCRPQAILPSLSELQRLSGSPDRRISEQIDCTFLRDLTRFPKHENGEDLGDLLLEFFAFYGSFNFKSRGLSLIAGKDVEKREYSPLYIQNPLQIELNVSQNVSGEEVIRISNHMRKALCTLETSFHKSSKDKSWGLVNLFNADVGDGRVQNRSKGSKKFLVSDLMNDGGFDVSPKSHTTLQRASSKVNFEKTLGSMKFNSQVKYLSGSDLVAKLGLEQLMHKSLKKRKKKEPNKTRPMMQPRPWTF